MTEKRKQTPGEVAALKRGQAKRQQRLKEGRERGDESQSARWARLLDGQLTVAELDDSEIELMRVYGHGKQFSGRAPRLPSHLARQFQQESLRRANDMFRKAAPAAVKRLLEIASDPDTKDNDAVRALQLVLERSLGKVPDKVLVEGMGKWAEAVAFVSDVDVDREMADMADEQG
jgi:hypothetical protein